jgi:hypothetical protein
MKESSENKDVKIFEKVFTDAIGELYLGLEIESKNILALRKSFPFTAKGRGFVKEEQDAYDETILRLRSVYHPAIRTIDLAGCDPVNNMPYLASKWLGGLNLAAAASQVPLPPDKVIDVIRVIFELSELISETMGKDGIWVETQAKLILQPPDETLPLMFWPRPLVASDSAQIQSCSVMLSSFLEEVLNEEAKIADPGQYARLERWLKLLKGSAKNATFLELKALFSGIVIPPPLGQEVVASPMIKTVADPPSFEMPITKANFVAYKGRYFLPKLQYRGAPTAKVLAPSNRSSGVVYIRIPKSGSGGGKLFRAGLVLLVLLVSVFLYLRWKDSNQLQKDYREIQDFLTIRV